MLLQQQEYGIDVSFDRKKILKLTEEKYKKTIIEDPKYSTIKDELLDGTEMTEKEQKLFLRIIDDIIKVELMLVKVELTDITDNIDLSVTKDEVKSIGKQVLEGLFPNGQEETVSDIAVKQLLKSADLCLKLKDEGVDINNLIKNFVKEQFVIQEKQIPFENITHKGIKCEGFAEIKFSFNVNKILELFEKKRIKAIQNNSKLGNEYLLYEHLNNLAAGTSKELKAHNRKIIDDRIKECLSILEEIASDKCEELYVNIVLNQCIYQPQNDKEFEDFVKTQINEVFTNNTEEYMSDVLISAWMRRKESELERNNKNQKKKGKM